jgi:hypothetical protein
MLPEIQAQLSTGAPLTERNRVTVIARGDRDYRISVEIGPPVPALATVVVVQAGKLTRNRREVGVGEPLA